MPNTLISVEPDHGEWTGTRTIYLQCERMQSVGLPTGQHRERCGRDSSWIIWQKGELTGNVFSLHLCLRHARPYIDNLEERE